MATVIVDKDRLGQRLLLLRTSRRWSLQEVEKLTGLPQSTVSRWERGAGKGYPELDRLAVLAEAYEVTVSDLLGPDWSLPGLLNRPFDVARSRGITSADLRMIA